MRNMDNERLIELVYERKQLWDVRDRNYHNRDYSRKLWNEIADELDCTSHVVKSKWQNLRDTYRKEFMKLIRTTGDASSNSPHWKYYDKLSFLNDVIALRKIKAPSLSSGRRVNSRRPTASAANTKNDQSEDEAGNEDGEEYTDINPLMYLCEVPQLLAEENEEVSSVQDTLSNDAHSAVDNQDSNNNHNSERVSKRISKKRMTITSHDATLTDNAQTQDYDEFDEHLDHYDIPNTNSTNNITNRRLARGVSNFDEDYHFLMSILPHLREIPKTRKLSVRQKLQQAIIDEQQNLLTSESLTTATTSATRQQTPQTLQATSIPQESQTTEITVDMIKIEKGNEIQSENDDAIIIQQRITDQQQHLQTSESLATATILGTRQQIQQTLPAPSTPQRSQAMEIIMDMIKKENETQFENDNATNLQ